jgi:amidase
MASETTNSIRDAVFTQRFVVGTGAFRVAIKDIIDFAGTITTASCDAVEQAAKPAFVDAVCVRRIRHEAVANRISVVGKTNLYELAFGANGVNDVYGTPANPFDASRMPGGSSSGSAVAVATGEADMALGSDTGGSIRIPASFCGVVGLKTTWGRVSTDGVWPLAPFLDTIGPLARTVTEAITGMDLLEDGFAARVPVLETASIRVARARPASVAVDPAIDAAVDAALARSGVVQTEVVIDRWDDIQRACLTVLLGEAWLTDRHLLVGAPSRLGSVSDATTRRLQLGAEITAAELESARAVRASGLASVESLFAEADVIAFPSTPTRAPLLRDEVVPITAFTRFANLLGLPALSIPAPLPSSHNTGPDAHLPIGMQLVGRPNSDELVCAVGLAIESALKNS